METLADLLELMYSARNSFTTIQAAIRQWYYPLRRAEAQARWVATQPLGSVASLGPVGGGNAASRQPQDIVQEETSRLWGRRPLPWRYEVDLASDGGSTIRIATDDVWWSYDPRSPYRALTYDASHEDQTEGIPRVIAYQTLTTLLDPCGIIPDLSIRLLGRATHAGRDAIRVRGLPREREGRGPMLWAGADEYELLVDLERGIGLRYAARMDDKEFASIEIMSVVFDDALPEDLFIIHVPSGGPDPAPADPRV